MLHDVSMSLHVSTAGAFGDCDTWGRGDVNVATIVAFANMGDGGGFVGKALRDCRRDSEPPARTGVS